MLPSHKALDTFTGFDNYSKPRSEYIQKLEAMFNEDLFEETKHSIWLSAYASNNLRSDYHWHTTACYYEWQSRPGFEDQYEAAWKSAQQ